MAEIVYRGRRAHQIENEWIKVVMTVEGGHIAEIQHKKTGINPLWAPPWPTMEPSKWDRVKNPEYGDDAESKLLSGILGHNLCLDLFGQPSKEEAAAGMTVHGEASVLGYEVRSDAAMIDATVVLPQAHLKFNRVVTLDRDKVRFAETVENLSAWDRPIAWTQHVTLGPPFLENGVTEFRATSVKNQALGNRPVELEKFSAAAESGGFSTHLMDPTKEKAWFVAFSAHYKLALGYVWRQKDFPWLGTWEENRSRKVAPWNGKTLTRGMEFGASPVPENRKKMIERGSLFGVPAYRWLAAREKANVSYWAFCRATDELESAVAYANS